MALQPIILNGIRGRRGTYSPFNCPTDQCIQAENVEFWRSSFARKRRGSSIIDMAGGTAVTPLISYIFSFAPSDNQAARELWLLDSAATPLFKRLAPASAWANVTNSSGDAVTLANNFLTEACQFNGKLFLAYDSTVNRLHMYDPAVGAIQRVGIAQQATAPTVANTGAGAYPAIIRYYKVAFAECLSGTIVNSKSNLSAAVSFTPSGAGTAARVTRPTAPGEKETHWLLYGSSDGANFVLISTIAVATTTYDDSAAPSSYAGEAAADANAFTPPPSAKYIVADKAQLVMAGAWETATGSGIAPSSRRIWWTSPLGATDQGDDQRISNTATIKSYTDIGEAVTGLASPQEGTIFVWSYRSMWKMVATGVAEAPYVTYKVTGARGCVFHKSIVSAEDENGNACTYWMSDQGPYRIGDGGMVSMVDDIADVWDSINIDASLPFHGLFYPEKHQIWWHIATEEDTTPNMRIVFDTRLGRVTDPGVLRYGWATHTSGVVATMSACTHSRTYGSVASGKLTPYMAVGANVLVCDTGTQDDDGGTPVNYESYIISRPYLPSGLGSFSGINESACLAAETTTAASISVSAIIDFRYRQVEMGTRLLTAPTGGAGTATRVFPRFDNSNVAMANAVQFRVGDSLPLQNDATPIPAWNLDALAVPNTPQGNI